MRLLTDSSVNLPPKTVAFFVSILRERAAAMSAPHVYPEPPELAGVLLALRRSEVGMACGCCVVAPDDARCRCCSRQWESQVRVTGWMKR